MGNEISSNAPRSGGILGRLRTFGRRSQTTQPTPSGSSPRAEVPGLSPRRHRPAAAPSREEQFARQVYEETRLFHGTTEAGRQSQRRHGFSLEGKVRGATAGHGSEHLRDAAFMEATASHHYLTTRRDEAAHFANLASEANESSHRVGQHWETFTPPGAEPAITRVIGAVRGREPDIDSGGPRSDAYRTAHDIPAGQVLGAADTPAGADAQVFQAELAQRGMRTSVERAGRLLRRVQSRDDLDRF